jgi:ABC-type lipoprotein release transport system permease subunit
MTVQIAWRNLWRNPRRTLIILTAIVIGISSMVVLSALSRGIMEGMVRNAINNLVGHVRIQDPGFRIDPSISRHLKDPDTIIAEIGSLIPADARVNRRIKVDGLLSTSREHIGITIVGIRPREEVGASFIGNPVYRGRMFEPDESNGLVVGEALLDRIDAKIGSKVVLMSQSETSENVSRAFRIKGTFKTELAQTEKSYVFVPLSILQKMLGVADGVTEITISTKQGQLADHSALLAENINARIQGREVRAEDWRQMLPAMDAYLKMFNGFMLIWFVVVFVAMGFGLVNTMLMAVYERMREFGLQRALGMRSSLVVRLVMSETLLLLIIGAIIANALAFTLIYLMAQSGIDLSVFSQGTEMWGIERIIIPVVAAWDVYTANGVVLVLGLLVGLYPALKAARFTPVETMRHN